MAYNKHVWASGETITSALLNNMENEIDGLSDLDHTLAGIKTFTSNPKVSKSDAGVQLDDTDGDGVDYILRSLSGKLELYDNDATAVKITDFITHAHSGTVGGAQIPYSNLTSRSHGSSDHTDRTERIFVPGSGMYTNGSMGQRGHISGPLLSDAVSEEAFGSFEIPSGQKYKAAGTAQQCYLFIRGYGIATTGDVVLTVQMLGFNHEDTGAGSTRGSITDTVYTISPAQELLKISAFTANLSTLHDMYSIRIVRVGTHGNDDYTDDLLIAGFAVDVQVDQ